jgi:Ca-activated chloride channel family protein
MTVARVQAFVFGLAAVLGSCSLYEARKAAYSTAEPTYDSSSLRAIPPGQDFNTEEYGKLVENAFASPFDEPLSTFSIDVDTASYGNVRRFLREGRLPPPDAVRIEELVNYFDYTYPAPEGEHPFSVTANLARSPWTEETLLMRVGLASTPVAPEDLPPANLVFLLDVSGSMGDANKLPLVRKAMRLLAEQLRPQDRVAIVAYAGAAGLVLPPTSGGERRKILAAIERLQAGGSTAGGAGIRLAYEVARESFQKKGLNRVILATDGDFNVGVSSEGELIRLIERERKSGVFLSVLGFGGGNLKDSKMEQIADHGNGNYAYIDSLLEARKALVEQMGGTLLTVAKDVKIQVEFNPAKVKRYRLIGYENRLLRARDFNDDKKDAGELGAGHTVTAFYELFPADGSDADGDRLKYQQREVRPEANESSEWATVRLRYKQPDEDESRLLAVAVDAPPAAFDDTPADFRFAAATVGYGQLLRESEHLGSTSFDLVAQIAEAAKGEDRSGLRSEMIYLLRTAQQLSEVRTASR